MLIFFFFAVIDPVGTLPVFIAVTRGCSEINKRKIALLASMYSCLILLFFVIAGEFILDALQIKVSAFQIGGGFVLFLFALSMIFGESKPDEEVKLAKGHSEQAVFPLAVPSIAGPGAILGAILLTEKREYEIWEQVITTMVMFSVIGITLVLLLYTNLIYKIIGNAGASVISRIMGLILSAVAVSNVLDGLKIYFEL